MRPGHTKIKRLDEATKKSKETVEATKKGDAGIPALKDAVLALQEEVEALKEYIGFKVK